MDVKEFMELAKCLNQERLFVSSERLHLQTLNEKVQKTVERLFHVTWIAKQQRLNLDSMILSKGTDSTPSACCQRANFLEGVRFTDGYKLLRCHECKYGEFIQSLRENPRLLAMCLAAGEKFGSDVIHRMVHIIIGSVYGYCLLQEDEQLVLQLLKHLIEMQLASNENPLRLLRHGTCAFGRVYKVFNEGLFSAKLFLTGALHGPIMNLLMEDELFLDIDPSKAVIRFPLHERLRRFGVEGTPQYAASLQRYRNWTINKLVHLTNRFIAGIRENLYCFPPSLLWLVKQLYNSVMNARKVEVREVGAMCADLVFAFFICPAIVNPEPYGICDAPISYIARFNLMQVAQILQVLAMSKWEEIDPKLMDLYGKFEKDCMSSLLDFLLEGGVDDMPTSNAISMQGLVRTAVLITESNLHSLILFLLHVLYDTNEKWLNVHKLHALLTILPQTSNTLCPTRPFSTNTSIPTPPQTPAPRKSILGKVGKNKNRNSSAVTDGDHLPQQNQPQQQQHHLLVDSQHVDEILLPCGTNNDVEDVLVISLNVQLEYPGMITEEKVMTFDREEKQVRMKVEDDEDFDEIQRGSGSGETQEKRTRFSLSHDQDSIGNTSDNLEAVSELASNHSVSSSIELENENDNLSDMISANVSGRGTPNVSGRDTPSSQVEGEEVLDPRSLDLPVTAEKQNREDISDKFGKFEIKKMVEDVKGDEAVSMVSDTWSTDVLASDSEMVEQGERITIDYVGQHTGGPNTANPNASTSGSVSAVLDTTETASEAWSIDVIASDSERLQDVDTDDTGSVARSDDAASITRSDDVSRYEGESGQLDHTVNDPLLRIDVPDHGDDNNTPLASGGRSPIDSAHLGSASGDLWFNTLQAAAGFIPVEPPAKQVDGVVNQIVPHQMTDLVNDFGDLGVHIREGAKSKVLNSAENAASHEQSKVPGTSNVFEHSNGVGNVHKASNDAENSDKESSFSVVSDDGASIASDVMGMQSLGRLSFAMDDFSDNGIINEDAVLSLNDISRNFTVDATVPSDVDMFVDVENGGMECMERGSVWRTGATPCDDDYGRLSPPFSSPGSIKKGADFSVQPLDISKQATTHFSNSDDVRQSSSLMGIYPVLSSPPGVNGHAMPVAVEQNVSPGVRNSSDSIASSSSSSGVGSASGDVAVAPESVGELSPIVGEQHCKKSAEMKPVESSVPTASTGAIPKSISFDVTAEKGDKESQERDDGRGKRGFFKNFKLTLKRPGRKSGGRYQNGYDKDRIELKSREQETDDRSTETSDDILAKYRKKPVDDNLSSGKNADNNAKDDSTLACSAGCKRRSSSISRSSSVFDDKTRTAAESSDVESLYAFSDAKRKLRLVLSSSDAITTPWLEMPLAGRVVGPGCGQKSELVSFLKMQLAEAINLQDKNLTAQLHEVLRCVCVFDKSGCRKLLQSLSDDYRTRYPYIAYLIRCRQSLLSSLSYLEQLLRRVERDKQVCNNCMISVCVRLFLERRERYIQSFTEEFQKLTVSDEKADLVEEFLQMLYKQLADDVMWQGASEAQLEMAQRAIERSIMSKIYIHALYPNGDGDVHRDQVLHEHITKLSKVISPDHKDLRIPKIYHYECPWPSAQAEVITINAYKTPGDKLQCVVHCCTTIMNLLRMANEKSIPAADDFIPVLVYVIIKGNPASLLSTVQYVNSFYHKQLKGEAEYWWTQFSSAVEFIKTMDYTE